jgi:disulfide bond formation protein DsbB
MPELADKMAAAIRRRRREPDPREPAMDIAKALPPPPRLAILAILAGAAATILGALWFEHVLGLKPCPLCLTQRTPYYIAMPLAAVALIAMSFRPARTLAVTTLLLLAGIFFWSAWLGAWHSGVEWGFFAGPTDCAGPASTGGPGLVMGDFLKQLETARVVSCTEAAWRFLGLSLAGWNVLISLAFAGLAIWSLIGRTQGSSSESQ